MQDITKNRAPSRISELFICSDQIHFHYARFLAASYFHLQRSRLNQLLLSSSRTGVRIWNKIPLKLREQSKAPFKHKLYIKLLLKVETEEVYVDISAITRSYLNSLFCLSFLSLFFLYFLFFPFELSIIIALLPT